MLHAFMVFIIFNGTVVYETGFVRWAGVALLTILGILWIRKIPYFCLGDTRKEALLRRESERKPEVDYS